MLARAVAAAKAAGVKVYWIHSDATEFSLPKKYNGAVCLCEEAFGLLGRGDDPIGQPLSILRNISRSLKPRAKAVLTVLNATAMLRRYTDKDVAEGRFDPSQWLHRQNAHREKGCLPLPFENGPSHPRNSFCSSASRA